MVIIIIIIIIIIILITVITVIIITTFIIIIIITTVILFIISQLHQVHLYYCHLHLRRHIMVCGSSPTGNLTLNSGLSTAQFVQRMGIDSKCLHAAH